MKIDVGKQAMNGREEDFEWIEFYASAFQIGSTIYIYPTYEFAENKKTLWKRQLFVFVGRGDKTV